MLLNSLIVLCSQQCWPLGLGTCSLSYAKSLREGR
jgi:hypothetical protein